MINNAIDKLYENDNYLLNINVNEPIEDHVCERAAVFRFGIYFQEELNDSEYKEYNLDCEYNRNGRNPKILPNFEKGIYPDIILHMRGNNNYNVVALEFKGWWNKVQKIDKKKIRELINKQGEYRYQEGYTILLTKTRNKVKVKRIIDIDNEGVERI